MSNKAKPETQPDNKTSVELGYFPDGASMYSHAATRRAQSQVKFTDRSPDVRRYWSKLDMLIEHEREQVARLERRAAEAKGTEKFGPICSRLQRTRSLLARLEAEQRLAS